jgi:hypothetical protein
MLLPLTLLAQESASKKEAEPEKKAAPAAEAPAPDIEKTFSGYIDVGARWVGWAGDRNTYRSMVNLNQGVRLVGMDFTIAPKASKLFDTARIQANNWGGDPYNTARFDVLKKGIYRYNGTYSNIAYFNYLPSFADPTAGSGAFLNQRATDTAIRNSDHSLEFRPGSRIIPFIGYQRNSDYGYGITTLVADRNEYPLRDTTKWGQSLYRGGVRIEMNRWHATVEQGYSSFKDDQSVYSTEKLYGNRTQTYLGQTLFLTQGQEFYRIRGDGPYTKALMTANPFSWLDLSGQFMYTKPNTISNYTQNVIGNLAQPSLFIFYPRGADYAYGDSRMPRTSGGLNAELRPFSRLRIRQTWETDSFTNTSTGSLTASIVTGTGSPINSATPVADKLEVNRSRMQTEGLLDILKGYTLRGGYRYEWGDSLLRAGSYGGSIGTERGELKRHVALAGFQARPIKPLTLNADVEIGDGVKTYYRTGLMDTRKYRLMGRVTLPKSLLFSAIYSRFENKNPAATAKLGTVAQTLPNQLDFRSQAASANLQWMPGGGKRITLIADYTRSSIRSDVSYLYPLGLFSLESLYRDNAHTGTLMADLRLPITKAYSGKLTFGGSFVTTEGTRPSRYYQPQGRLQLPLTPRLEFFSEWRYYGLTQANYTFEGFRSHNFMGGFRFVL